jgi:tetratricopeptide (TPR) repeat protein
MFLDYFRIQMPALAIALGFVGLVAALRRNRKVFLFLGLLFFAGSGGLVAYLNFKLPPNTYLLEQFSPETEAGRVAREVRERDYFFTPAFVFFAHWVAIGAVCLLRSIPRSLAAKTRLLRGSWGTAFVTAIIMAVPLASVAMNYAKSSRDDDWLAYDYGFNILNSCEEHAILFTGGDNDTFPLWYLQEVENQREDVSVVCLPLLNTPWYWKQLRDKPNGLPLPHSDEDLARLGAVPLFQPTQFKAGELSLKLNASRAEPRILRLQDLGVLNIIKHNGWRRPIYFAATVSPEAKLGLDNNLVMEGMVYRLLEHGRPQDSNLQVAVNVDRTIHLIENVYRFRGVAHSSVRKTYNARRLLTNYARVFSLTARELLRRGEAAQARGLLDTATRIVPEDPASRYFRAIALQILGETEKAVEDFLSIAERYPDLIIQQARNFATQGRPDLAEMLLTRYLSNNQSDASALALLHAIRSAETQLLESEPAPQRSADL